MNPVRFEGEGPYAMPTLQGGEASALSENVEMTLVVPVKGQLERVRVTMPVKIADQLASRLADAAADARANKRSGL